MLRPSVLTALVGFSLLAPGGVFAQTVSAYQFDKVEADYLQVPVPLAQARREVVVDRLELRTRPIPEAAVLDVLRAGAHVPLVSEGGGWATMDLGGGFLGWMRSDGLAMVQQAPPAPKKPPLPFPVSRHLRPPEPTSAPPAVADTEVEIAMDPATAGTTEDPIKIESRARQVSPSGKLFF